MSTATSVIDQYRFYVPRLDVSSIGSGGGSIVAVEPGGGALTVGPKSAGAVPGPACYGRGDRPTVTDADLLLGHLNPDYFLGGSIELDRDAAEAAFAPLAAQLGAEVLDVALGALRVVDAQMADLIRKETVESGYDPRRMTILAYGGAGPLHASGVARELGVSKVVVPLGDIASTFSAYGIGRSDLLHVHDLAVTLPAPSTTPRSRRRSSRWSVPPTSSCWPRASTPARSSCCARRTCSTPPRSTRSRCHCPAAR